jgi:oxygen-dependent protoporphyrinogen oxidase
MRRIAIVGGGIAGLAAAWQIAELARAGVAVEATVFESSARLGGLVETVREGGFTIECGPDAWLTAKPWAAELATELGLANELLPSNDSTRKTWLYLDGRLVAMPDGMNMMVPTDLDALANSPLFTPAAVAAYRAEPGRAAELLAAIPPHDESVADFTLRHFGPEVLARVAAPLLSGIFGGDVQTLSVCAVMPAFVRMERQHGSLIAALQHAFPREPAATFTTLRSGLGTLIDRLVAAIPPHCLRRNTRVASLHPDGTEWTVTTSSEDHAFDAVLLAAPLDAARTLLHPLLPEAAALLPTEASSAVLVALCYPDDAVLPVPPGFGFLVAPPTDSRLLACTFADRKFPHRAPPGGRLVRAFFGGPTAERLIRCANDEVAAIAAMELARILTPPAPLPPAAVTIVRRWPRSLPQYAVGHLDRTAELDACLAALPGLHLLGNSCQGVGLPDLIRDARQAAVTATSVSRQPQFL